MMIVNNIIVKNHQTSASGCLKDHLFEYTILCCLLISDSEDRGRAAKGEAAIISRLLEKDRGKTKNNHFVN